MQSSSKIIAKECKFVFHIPRPDRDSDDVHLIKERLFLEDGSSRPNLKILKNFERDFGITKRHLQIHKERRESESLDNLDIYSCTESDLKQTLARAIGKPMISAHLKKIFSMSPYIYGADITSCSIIKKTQYMDVWPDAKSFYSVAYFDTETDMVNGTDDTIIGTTIFENNAFICVTKDFIKGLSDVENRFKKRCEEHLTEYMRNYNLEIEFLAVDRPVDIFIETFNRLHKWSPDILAIWNMVYDIDMLIKMCKKYKVDPKTFTSDPRIPYKYRIFNFKRDDGKKVTASNKVKPKDSHDLWNVLSISASFTVLDAMCTYRYLRLAAGEKQSFALDAIGEYEKVGRKIKIPEPNGEECKFVKEKWHMHMQENRKIDYMCYALGDPLLMRAIEDKTKDLSSRIGDASASSEFSKFNSQPRRIADDYYYFLRYKKNQMLAVGSVLETQKLELIDEYETLVTQDDDDDEDEDEEGLGLAGWIMTLMSHMSVNGLCLIEEDETVATGIRGHTYDSDSTSAYPRATSCANVSKRTNRRELCNVSGIDDEIFRKQNLNIVLGRTNSIEYCQNMFNMPSPDKWLQLYLEQ